MNRSAGGFVLLLIGALGLIGFLTGNLDRWLAFLFTPPGSTAPAAGAGAPAPVTSSPASAIGVRPTSGNQRTA